MRNLTFLFLFLNLSMSAQYYPVQTFQLENGLTVFLNEDPNAARVFGAVVVNAGSKHDPPDATGIAHYLEHLLFKGTTRLGALDYAKEKIHLDSINALYDQLAKTRDEDRRRAIQLAVNEQARLAGQYGKPGEFDQLLKSIGGAGINAFTNPEMTFYYNYFPPNQVEKWLELYSHRFQEPVFRSFQTELEVVYEEKNRSMDDFQDVILDKFNEQVFGEHPYGSQTTLGSVEHLKNPSLTKMYEFFRTYYVANNMALILTGNFDAEAVKPAIREKFGRWRPGEIPAFPDFPLKKFDGKEVIKTRMTPIKAGLLGFKTVPKTHPDRVALDVFNYMIFNDKETGTLNQLQLNNQLLWCGALPNLYNDDGSTVVFFVPKLFFQSLNKAESLVMAEIEKVKRGDFAPERLEAVKNQVYVEFVKALEDPETRAVAMAEAFNMGISWETFQSYPELVRQIRKEDLMRVVGTYFGDDFLAMYSRMGFPRKKKLEKPPYRPVKPGEEGRSDYATSFERLPSTPVRPRFIDFSRDVQITQLKNGSELHTSPNPVNDVFTLTIRYQVGTEALPNLDMAARLMNYAGTPDRSLTEVKDQLAQLGAGYRFSANTNYLEITLAGLDRHLREAVEILSGVISRPLADDRSKKVVLNQLQTERRIEKRTPSQMGAALLNYALYGADSPYLTRARIREVRKMPAGELLDIFRSALDYRFSAHYAGALSPQEVGEQLAALPAGEREADKVQLPVVTYGQPTIFFAHDRKAVQSQVYYYVAGAPFQLEEYPQLQAFNAYFGLGFSSLVFQEIREYRSLAYSAYGRLLYPAYKPGVAVRYVGYIGTQGDKTLDAVEVMNGLLTDMPVKEDRLPALRENLSLQAATAYPDFRDRSVVQEDFQILGFERDPNEAAYPVYQEMDFELIRRAYEKHIAGRPLVIAIYGDKRRVDRKKLEQIGRVAEVRRKRFWGF
jgi:predicted Zn-dependent peptidase